MTGTVALIVAAGSGVRAGGPKQYRPLGGSTVIGRAIDAFSTHPDVDFVQVVYDGDDAAYAAAIGSCLLPPPVRGGVTRQDSVRLGLEALSAAGAPERVLIHDAARPLVPAAVIGRVLAALDAHDGATPALPIVDSVRHGGATVEGEVDRTGLWRVQTPQGFRFDVILAAHRAAAPGATDDVAIARAYGLTVALVEGDEAAMKLTTSTDFTRAEALLTAQTTSRTGMGFDVHAFAPGDHVMLCGVPVPHTQALAGHSDADVGLHALTDAILGALAAGDIGHHFPPSDPRWRGAESGQFLQHAAQLVSDAGGRIEHVDVTLICEAPKVGPHRDAMRARLAELLGLPLAVVSVKATTTEQLGFTGRREGIAAQAVATLAMPRVAHA